MSADAHHYLQFRLIVPHLTLRCRVWNPNGLTLALWCETVPFPTATSSFSSSPSFSAVLASQRPRKQRNLLCLKATIKFDRDLGLAQFPTEMVKNHGRGFHFFSATFKGGICWKFCFKLWFVITRAKLTQVIDLRFHSRRQSVVKLNLLK